MGSILEETKIVFIKKDMTQSPFRKFEETYCNECDDYAGCIGLIVSASTGETEEISDFGNKATNEWMSSIKKNIGASLFTSRYELILKCMRAREWENNEK